MAQRVADRAIQAHGAMGLSEDTPIADFFLRNRYVRITDGPDEVHLSQLGKLKIAEFADPGEHA
jgi:acyl-CoA dehydrogenase